MMETPSISQNDIVIAVMGVTGSGKSTFISKITGQNVGIGHSLTSQTATASIYSYQYKPDRKIYLIDTPGFDDTSRSDTIVLKEIAFFLSRLYRDKVNLAGIIYLHRITDNRLSGTALKNLNAFRQLCGPDSYGHVILTTSMWNLLDPSASHLGDERENELKTTSRFWGAMCEHGSRVIRWTGEEKSALVIIDQIVDMHAKSGTAILQIQKELCDDNLPLDETAAGRVVQKELAEAKDHFQKEIESLREAQAEMKTASKHELAKQLLAQQQDFEQKLRNANKAQEDLKTNLRRLESEKEEEYRKLLENTQRQHQKLAEVLDKREADYRKLQEERKEDEKSFKEAQKFFADEMAALQQQIKNREIQAQAAEDRRIAAEQRGQIEAERQKLEDERRQMEAEWRMKEEVQEELRRQYLEEQEEIERQEERARQEIEAQRRRKSSTSRALPLLGVLAGFGTAAAGLYTLNPAMVASGLTIAGKAADKI
ncbi:hypothetical protein ONS96_008342 [Cadophora gregata f. sp. sojae]|nr:hypothetical protein ONS96_008342 [Cadophora gregata f. sp. sojae]